VQIKDILHENLPDKHQILTGQANGKFIKLVQKCSIWKCFEMCWSSPSYFKFDLYFEPDDEFVSSYQKMNKYKKNFRYGKLWFFFSLSRKFFNSGAIDINSSTKVSKLILEQRCKFGSAKAGKSEKKRKNDFFFQEE